MFKGHFVATTNITTSMTSGMICVAVMVGSDSGVAAGLNRAPPNRMATRPRMTEAATVTSRIRRRVVGRLELSSLISLSASGAGW
ncbi:hypothetical protein PJL18_03694 [Paenarthrobacter nicotinovorans]|nr:hypothetical protein [Paenarthrobacter nicotinovorans]